MSEVKEISTAELCERSKHCTSHHLACDCREWQFRCLEINYTEQGCEVADLQRELKQVVEGRRREAQAARQAMQERDAAIVRAKVAADHALEHEKHALAVVEAALNEVHKPSRANREKLEATIDEYFTPVNEAMAPLLNSLADMPPIEESEK